MRSPIDEYYASYDEAGRLEQGLFQLEAERTRRLLERFLTPGSTIVDVGGGAGAYAFWLTEQGHRVHLVDASDALIDQARAREEQTGTRLAGVHQGDARALEEADGIADAALLLGPLYHLTERDDRIAALKEAHRVLKSGGLLCAAGISRFASLVDGFGSGDVFEDDHFHEIVSDDLATGQHRNPTKHPHYFTTAFFHRPEELTQEVRAAGFTDTQLFAIEGPGAMVSDFEERWKDESARERMLELIAAVETEPALMGMSAHILCSARKGV